MAKHDNTVLYIAGMNLTLPYDDQRTGRSSPLRFVLFRCPGDNTPEGQLYRMRRESLKLRPDGMAVLGIYDELLIAYGGNKIAAMRGFLVNHHLQAASHAELAQAIGCRSAKTMMAAVRRLLAAGLLTEVDRPDFEGAIKADKTIEVSPRPPCPRRDQLEHGKFAAPNDSRADDAPQGAEAHANDRPEGREAPAQGNAMRTRKRALPADSMAASGPPGGFRKVPESGGGTLDARQADVTRADEGPPTPPAAAAAPSPPSAHGNGQRADEKQPATAAPSPTDTPTADPPREDGTLTDGHASDEPTNDTAPGDSPPASTSTGQREAIAPHQAEPSEPTEADPGQAAAGGGPHPRQHADMSWHAEAFAEQVVNALYPTHDELVLQGRRCTPPQAADEFRRRELACIAGCFDKALAAADQVGAMRLLQRSLKGAATTFRKRCKKTRGRVWVYEFKQYSREYVASGPP